MTVSDLMPGHLFDVRVVANSNDMFAFSADSREETLSKSLSCFGGGGNKLGGGHSTFLGRDVRHRALNLGSKELIFCCCKSKV